MQTTEELDKFISSNPDSRELKRALAIKMFQEGHSEQSICNSLRVCRSFIGKWKSRYKKEGLGGIKLGYKGSDSYLSDSEKERIYSWLRSEKNPQLDALKSYVFTEFGVTYQSNQSYYDLFHNAKVNWKKSQKKNPRRDESQVKSKRIDIKKNSLDGQNRSFLAN